MEHPTHPLAQVFALAFTLCLAGAARAQSPVTPPPPESAPPPPPKTLRVSESGLFRPSVLLQGWFDYQHADESSSTFRIRRAEIHLKGELLPGQLAYEVFVDPAKVLEFNKVDIPVGMDTVTVQQPAGAVAMLQDAYLTYMTPFADFSLGQFKIPVSWEGFNSSSKLLFAERALVSRRFGDKRDIGFTASKVMDRFGWWAGVFNGAGQNRRDNNNGKDATVRFEVYPVPGLILGAVAYATVGQRDQAGAKDRLEADVRFEQGPLLLQGEYIFGRDVRMDGADPTKSHGFYGAAAYRIQPDLQAAARVGYFDPDLDSDVDPTAAGGDDEAFELAGGLNYYLQGHDAKLQLELSRFQFDDKTAALEAILAAQVHF